MEKLNFKKLALMGIAGGALVASQGFAEVDKENETLLAGGRTQGHGCQSNARASSHGCQSNTQTAPTGTRGGNGCHSGTRANTNNNGTGVSNGCGGSGSSNPNGSRGTRTGTGTGTGSNVSNGCASHGCGAGKATKPVDDSSAPSKSQANARGSRGGRTSYVADAASVPADDDYDDNDDSDDNDDNGNVKVDPSKNPSYATKRAQLQNGQTAQSNRGTTR